MGVLMAYLVNKCSNNRFPWLPKGVKSIPGALAQVSWWRMRAVFSSQVLKAQTYLHVWVLCSFSKEWFWKINTSTQSTASPRQPARYVGLGGFTTGLCVSSPLLRGRWDRRDCQQIPPSLSGSHMGHMCLHLSSKPMCPSLPHPCPTSFLLLFKEKP